MWKYARRGGVKPLPQAGVKPAPTFQAPLADPFVGVAFSRSSFYDFNDFNALNDFNDFNGFNGFYSSIGAALIKPSAKP